MIFTQAIERNANLYANHTATIFNGRKHSWAEVKQRISKLATGILSQGASPGDRVAILALNSDRYLEYYYACAWAGVAMVPLNIRWSVSENQYAYNDSGAKMLFVDDMFLPTAYDIAPAHPLIFMGEQATPESMVSYESLVDNATEMPAHDAQPTDMLGIFYTGGTTGFPKGVMLSHQNVWSSSFSILMELRLKEREHPVMMVAGPMFHLAAGAMCWASVIGGITITIIPAFDVEQVLHVIARDQVTDTLLVPTMVNMLLADEKLADADLSSLQQIIYGASPMPEGTLLEAMNKMPTVGFCQAYGQTEMAPVCSVLPPEYHVLEGEKAGRIRSAGRVTYTLALAIKDENGKDLAPNEVGEICVKGANVMMGYWNKEEQTQAAIKDGWLHSGDAGYVDEEGFIFLVDRVKDMIISGGENVFSAEVESAVSKHPAVHEVAVIGIPSVEWGESVHAIVRLKPEHSCAEQELIDFCREYIAGYKTPRSVEFRTEPFPITGAAKIQKNVLREPYWQNEQQKIG
ncbi:long-chain-fatty-acid--CoA ligase [Thalassotalea sp. LPB0316]|uniref:long-chain-fatty-acid--CoA ligase n=1 Tax=Thalassotalea sp. LPB0316 TaxID=2769490 RepID=UPI001868C664|nr:long-chain-fatty-acid--CoA ligase [Thalassotalea sp. LPB0316]QOL24582.1 long-chain-fatty-acid--CoA ligase [Thalassotalea sp. LPB0316]